MEPLEQSRKEKTSSKKKYPQGGSLYHGSAVVYVLKGRLPIFDSILANGAKKFWDRTCVQPQNSL